MPTKHRKRSTTVDENIFNIVKASLDKFDPEQLIKMGCPPDEYEPEAVEIAQHIENEMGIKKVLRPSAHDIWMIVCVILHVHFSQLTEPILYLPMYREIAADIFQQMEESYGSKRG